METPNSLRQISSPAGSRKAPYWVSKCMANSVITDTTGVGHIVPACGRVLDSERREVNTVLVSGKLSSPTSERQKIQHNMVIQCDKCWGTKCSETRVWASQVLGGEVCEGVCSWEWIPLKAPSQDREQNTKSLGQLRNERMYSFFKTLQ